MDKNLGLSAGAYAALAGFSSDWRDTWWHQDYLAFLAPRWGLPQARSLLDVGCGAGHWGQRLATLLPDDAEVVGVDHEPGFLDAAQARAQARGLPQAFTYTQGRAEALPFPDGRFDVVTCQTVLIHVADAAAVIAEMARVTRPGGVVLLAEPSNQVNAFVYRQTLPERPHEDLLRLLAFDMACIRGKRALGQGDHAVGERLLPLLAAAGLMGVEVRNNDRCASFTPPYDSPAEQLTLAHIAANNYATAFGWGTYETTRALYLAGGGDEAAFDGLWQAGLAWQARSREDVTAGRHSFGGGLVMYAAWGHKPQ